MHWSEDPEATLQAIDRLDPVERVAGVAALIDADPEAAQHLCDRLPRGAAQDRCKSVAARPHLWEHHLVTSKVGRVNGGRPGVGDLVPAETLRSTFADVKPLRPDCARSADLTACVTDAALAAARTGDAARAVGICRSRDGSSEAGLWIRECLFRSAEVLTDVAPVDHYRAATEICLLAGDFEARCLEHVTARLATGVPVATSASRAWKPFVQAADAVRAAWADRDPAMGAVLVQRFWSEAAWHAYARVDQVSGDPLDAVPAVAVPHFRAAAAGRYLELADDAARSLTADVVQLQAALAWRVRAAPEPADDTEILHTNNYWTSDAGEAAKRPAIIYKGTARRTVATRESADLAICVLEAAARIRQNGPLLGLIEQGLSYDDEAVQWTARRLLEHIQPATGAAGPVAAGQP